MFSAETGGTPGAQVEIVTKSGSNEFHGTAFEYLRNAIFDSRTPFDPATHPPFKLNQFGSTLGGTIFKNKTFFFVSYEAYRQREAESLIGYVPTLSLRAQVVATSPVLTPFINGFPLPNDGLLSSQVGQWTGQASEAEDERMLERSDWTTGSPTSSLLTSASPETKTDSTYRRPWSR